MKKTEDLARLKVTIQNRLNEARNNGTGVARVMISTLSEMLKVLNGIRDSKQAEVVRCKDCKHRPSKPEDYDPAVSEEGFRLEFPDGQCPCQCDDGYYSWYPADEWYCGNGKRKGGGKEWQ